MRRSHLRWQLDDLLHREGPLTFESIYVKLHRGVPYGLATRRAMTHRIAHAKRKGCGYTDEGDLFSAGARYVLRGMINNGVRNGTIRRNPDGTVEIVGPVKPYLPMTETAPSYKAGGTNPRVGHLRSRAGDRGLLLRKPRGADTITLLDANTKEVLLKDAEIGEAETYVDSVPTLRRRNLDTGPK